MMRPHYRISPTYHEYPRHPDGRFAHPVGNTGERPSLTFDWDRAISGLYAILAEVYE
jgi:hypothetical protein